MKEGIKLKVTPLTIPVHCSLSRGWRMMGRGKVKCCVVTQVLPPVSSFPQHALMRSQREQTDQLYASPAPCPFFSISGRHFMSSVELVSHFMEQSSLRERNNLSETCSGRKELGLVLGMLFSKNSSQPSSFISLNVQ